MKDAFAMHARSWVIGSSSECDIRVESPTVSAMHCRLTASGESFLLEDLHSSNGTFVAGDRIDGPRIVVRGDPVTLGRTVPLPWPVAATSITIGRLPDNDLVIPLETVSGHHARLERDGSQVYLVDRESTNGTAINDPLNKITRAPLNRADFVFLGTHRVSAAELLSKLPVEPAPQATVLERQRPEALGHPTASRDSEAMTSLSGADSRPLPLAIYSRSSWLRGIGISACCLVILLGISRLLRSPATTLTDQAAVSPPADDRSTVAIAPSPSAATSPSAAINPVATERGSASKQSPPDEKVIRRSEEAVVLLGLRIGREVAISKETAWACRPDAVICPTAVLAYLDDIRHKNKELSVSLAVFTPAHTIEIVDHASGQGEAEGFSIATLESSLDAVCTTNLDGVARVARGQELAMLSGQAVNDEPKTITRRFLNLTVDHVDRGDDKLPQFFDCSGKERSGNVMGSPVFDAAGAVVGCALTADKLVRVVPIRRLASLLHTRP